MESRGNRALGVGTVSPRAEPMADDETIRRRSVRLVRSEPLLPQLVPSGAVIHLPGCGSPLIAPHSAEDGI
jgi:hypothetical protein